MPPRNSRVALRLAASIPPLKTTLFFLSKAAPSRALARLSRIDDDF
ncbi:hypothetical protein [Achromobacter piechaudii]|uniref:Uncharacterized protein n=1 Tax=Achromobacter piechaudii ATCC 43553 TaxID=742159 RepID=D4XDD4_9BURK|nr:hypothetical protein [Achromobacter piechaudii]EFF75149.1 hypothetical protein HMPREF0004_3481 [Achromobacter piechaudii ATCC 43553]